MNSIFNPHATNFNLQPSRRRERSQVFHRRIFPSLPSFPHDVSVAWSLAVAASCLWGHFCTSGLQKTSTSMFWRRGDVWSRVRSSTSATWRSSFTLESGGKTAVSTCAKLTETVPLLNNDTKRVNITVVFYIFHFRSFVEIWFHLDIFQLFKPWFHPLCLNVVKQIRLHCNQPGTQSDFPLISGPQRSDMTELWWGSTVIKKNMTGKLGPGLKSCATFSEIQTRTSLRKEEFVTRSLSDGLLKYLTEASVWS